VKSGFAVKLLVRQRQRKLLYNRPALNRDFSRLYRVLSPKIQGLAKLRQTTILCANLRFKCVSQKGVQFSCKMSFFLCAAQTYCPICVSLLFIIIQVLTQEKIDGPKCIFLVCSWVPNVQCEIESAFCKPVVV